MMTHRTFIQLYQVHDLDLSKPYTYGFAETAYGKGLLISHSGYLLAFGFTTEINDLRRPSWPITSWQENHQQAEDLWKTIESKNSIKAILLGTDFQQKVWQALLDLPQNQLVTYQDLANNIGHPKAVRAVANAVGANPISIVIPCHLVVRTDGRLGGYRWGTEIKKSILKKGL